jgi:hypothetical protein
VSYLRGPEAEPCPDPDEFIPPIPSYFFGIHSAIVLLSTPRSSRLSLPFGFSDQDFVCISHLTNVATWPAHPILDVTTLTIFGEELTKNLQRFKILHF